MSVEIEGRIGRAWVLRAGNILAVPEGGYRNYSSRWNYFRRWAQRGILRRRGTLSLCCIRGGRVCIPDAGAGRCRLSRRMCDETLGVDMRSGDLWSTSLALWRAFHLPVRLTGLALEMYFLPLR